MATANVVSAWKDDSYAYLCGVVTEPWGKVEYGPVSVSLVDGDGNPKPTARLREELIKALSEARKALVPPSKTSLPITGQVQV